MRAAAAPAVWGRRRAGSACACCARYSTSWSPASNQYLNNIVEQDHRAIKRRVTAKQGFRAFHAARRTIQGYEAMHMIRKGQARWVSGSDGRRQIQFINKLFGMVA